MADWGRVVERLSATRWLASLCAVCHHTGNRAKVRGCRPAEQDGASKPIRVTSREQDAAQLRQKAWTKRRQTSQTHLDSRPKSKHMSSHNCLACCAWPG